MKSPEEIANDVTHGLYGQRADGILPLIESRIAAAIEADRAQPERDGSLHASVIGTLKDRAELDDDETEGYTYRQRAIAWIKENPDEFWDEFGGPLIDDVEYKFHQSGKDANA